MSDEKVLTKENAEQFLVDEFSVDLTGFTAIEDDAAAVLSKHDGALHLYGLLTLSDAAAESLSKHQCDLNFDSLSSLSDAAAESLSKHQGDLNFDSLSSLSDAAAESLSKHQGYLSLDRLASLSIKAAESLRMHKGGLSICRVSVLEESGREVTETLMQHPSLAIEPLSGERFANLLRARFLEFDEVWELAKIAEGYSKFRYEERTYGNEWEDCFRFLQRAAGRTIWELNEFLLVENEYPEYTFYFWGTPEEVEARILAGLKSLSDEAAGFLSEYEGALPLNGLTSLSDTAAEYVARHEGRLILESLTTLSDAAAKSLHTHEGELVVDLDKLPETAAAILRKHPSYANKD